MEGLKEVNLTKRKEADATFQYKRKETEMTKRRIEKLRCMVSLMLAVIFLVSTPVLEVSAAGAGQDSAVEVLTAEVIVLATEPPRTRTMLQNNTIVIGEENGALMVSATTGATARASVLGVKDIKIYKKVWYGWREVATSDGGEAQDCVNIGVTVYYTNAERGATYKATCVHYGNVDGYSEVSNESGSYVF